MKFKGWDKDRKVMYSHQQLLKYQMSLDVNGNFYNPSKIDIRLAPRYYSNIIPIEYVGNINGVDLWEGDIIYIDDENMLLNYDMKFPSETFAKVLVPLRSKETQQKLFKSVQENLIDTIGSDHAPHSLEEKSDKFDKAPSGFPSLDFAAQIIEDELSKKGVN